MDIVFNLKPRKASSKDYSFHRSNKTLLKSRTLGAVQFPEQLIFASPILSQDQENCTAFSSVATRANEIANGNFDPEQFWNDELSFAGVTTSQGFDIEVPAATGKLKGFSPVGNPTLRQDSPSAYFWVHASNGLDLFDSCRAAMLSQNRPLQGGVVWMNDWTNAQGGIINTNGTSVAGGHCIKIAGWKAINGTTYMILQNSWGPTFGDLGFFYISRAIFNGSFNTFGIYYWSDDPNQNIKTLGSIQALYQNVITLIKSFFNR